MFKSIFRRQRTRWWLLFPEVGVGIHHAGLIDKAGPIDETVMRVVALDKDGKYVLLPLSKSLVLDMRKDIEDLRSHGVAPDEYAYFVLGTEHPNGGFEYRTLSVKEESFKLLYDDARLWPLHLPDKAKLGRQWRQRRKELFGKICVLWEVEKVRREEGLNGEE